MTKDKKFGEDADNKIYSLEAARGVAALCVVLLHAGSMMAPEQYSGKVGLNDFFNFGKYGVDFFFVLSGYIIFNSSRKSLGQPKRFNNFIIRRIFRLFPTYWAVLVFSITLSFFQNTRAPISLEFLFAQLTLTAKNLWIGPAWTLQYEIIFYLFISLAIVSKRLAISLGITWIALVLYFWLAASDIEKKSLMGIITDTHCLLFFFGMLSVKLSETRFFDESRGPALILFAGVILFASIAQTLSEETKRILLGIIFSSMILQLIALEKKWAMKNKMLVLLGQISYSLYISHVIFIGLTYATLTRLKVYSILGEPLNFLMAVTVSIIAAIVFHILVERPGMRYGKLLEKKFR